ncbi:MAG: serine/threonine protein kinase, partial [Myxococcaceae bacterium]|nr:serine/threonine protein kinase [Myxococcaceae bacterium]
MNDTLPSGGREGRLVGKFRLERKLGSGAMGEVFLGVHVVLGNFVAVKVLNATTRGDPGAVARFANEARAVAAIGHENIAGIIDHDELPDGTPCIVMEYVEGATLRDLLFDGGPLALKTAAQLMIDVLAAVGAAHAKGVVHRDLKPENVRVTPGGRAKVLDFGVAKLLQSPDPKLSTDGALIGTPHYMAPEQVNAEAIDGRTDLYATGVMLFECVTGQRPFEAPTLVALLQKQLQAAPPWPSKLRPGLPSSLEQVILKALEKEPGRRYQSAGEMAEALRALLPELEGAVAPAPAVAPPGALYTPTRKEQGAVATPALAAPEPSPAPRRSRLPWVALLLAVVTFGVTIAALMTWKPAGDGPLVIEAPPEKPKPAPEVPLPPEPVAPSPPVAEPPQPPVQQVAKNNKPKPVPRAPEPVKPVEPEPRKPQNGVTMIETGRDRKT